MTSVKPHLLSDRKPTPLVWATDTDIKQMIADEAVLQYAADRVYLTLGQVQMPLGAALDGRLDSISVEPVARLVLTLNAFNKLRDMLNVVGDQLAAAETPKSDGQSR